MGQGCGHKRVGWGGPQYRTAACPGCGGGHTTLHVIKAHRTLATHPQTHTHVHAHASECTYTGVQYTAPH